MELLCLCRLYDAIKLGHCGVFAVTHIANTASALRPTKCQTMTSAILSIKHQIEQHVKFRLFQFHTFCLLSLNSPTVRGNYRSAPFLEPEASIYRPSTRRIIDV